MSTNQKAFEAFDRESDRATGIHRRPDHVHLTVITGGINHFMKPDPEYGKRKNVRELLVHFVLKYK
jgi:hypothetical protein